MDEPEDTQPLAIIYMLLQIGASLWMLWSLIPGHQRQAAKMRLILAGQRITAACARRAGAGAMRAELAPGSRSYALPYGPSLGRDGLAEADDPAGSGSR